VNPDHASLYFMTGRLLIAWKCAACSLAVGCLSLGNFLRKDTLHSGHVLPSVWPYPKNGCHFALFLPF